MTRQVFGRSLVEVWRLLLVSLLAPPGVVRSNRVHLQHLVDSKEAAAPSATLAVAKPPVVDVQQQPWRHHPPSEEPPSVALPNSSGMAMALTSGQRQQIIRERLAHFDLGDVFPALRPVSEYIRGWEVGFGAVVSICVLAFYFAIGGIVDVRSFVLSLKGNACRSADRACAEDVAATAAVDPSASKKWSMVGLIGLLAYRFYSGFLAGTWLPFLLAMEGQTLFGEKQAFFMALAKLIYGLLILLNPILGFLGDRAISVSHGAGRRLFMRLGVTFAGLGIYMCVLARRGPAMLPFLVGIVLWRLGEALNDVTTEALVPELVSQEQFGQAGVIKAAVGLFGGLVGYVSLLLLAGVHYTWLYYAYPLGMIICMLPSIWLLNKDQPYQRSSARRGSRDGALAAEAPSLWGILEVSYLTPARYKGGFPMVCLAVFLFGLGSSPMCYILLLVRDLVGIEDPVEAQQQLCVVSLSFFIAAALAAVLIGVFNPKKPPQQQQEEQRQGAVLDVDALAFRAKLLIFAQVMCAVFVALLPATVLWETKVERRWAFLVTTIGFGASFGAILTFIQDVTWKVLPPDANLACAMGFNVMSRAVGIGLGNFICGLILDSTYAGKKNSSGIIAYEAGSYVAMCWISAGLILCSAWAVRLVIHQSTAAASEQARVA